MFMLVSSNFAPSSSCLSLKCAKRSYYTTGGKYAMAPYPYLIRISGLIMMQIFMLVSQNEQFFTYLLDYYGTTTSSKFLDYMAEGP